MLRNKIGDEHWWAGIRSYYRKYINSHATTDNFQDEMEAACECSLDAFFDQWLYQRGDAVLSGEWHFDDARQYASKCRWTRRETTITRFRFDVEIGLYGADDVLPDIHTMTFSAGKRPTVDPADSKPARVVDRPANRPAGPVDSFGDIEMRKCTGLWPCTALPLLQAFAQDNEFQADFPADEFSSAARRSTKR